jgi:hypothetical protein
MNDINDKYTKHKCSDCIGNICAGFYIQFIGNSNFDNSLYLKGCPYLGERGDTE